MKHLLLTSLLAVAATLTATAATAQKAQTKQATAAKAKPFWLDADKNRVNTMAPRAHFFAYETIEKAMRGNKAASERFLSLEGDWKFRFDRHHYDRPVGFEKPNFDDSAWKNFPCQGSSKSMATAI